MPLFSRATCKVLRSQVSSSFLHVPQRRQLLTLAIESSCDDSSVSIVKKHDSTSPSPPSASVHFLKNITADTRQYKGIHPVVALASHQENLAKLVNKSLQHLPPASEHDSYEKTIYVASNDDSLASVRKRKPDFISVTRGPGMFSNLSTGLDTAKGLAVAWQIPLVGVHHMQAHLLTPRLAAALDAHAQTASLDSTGQVEFPFLSILVSGGHTLLVHSRSLVDHEILASTVDIAIGDALDKLARDVLPTSYLESLKTTMYGKALEAFVFPNGKADYVDYTPPATRGQETARNENTKWGSPFGMPYGETRKMAFSFAGVLSTAQRRLQDAQSAQTLNQGEGGHSSSDDARIALGRQFMTVCFEHLASRTIIALQNLQNPTNAHTWTARDRRNYAKNSATQPSTAPVKTIVLSGGVAANQFLRSLLRAFLDVRGFGDVKIVAPPMHLCTDNAAMIGWTGIEMFEAGWRSDLKCRAVRKWALDARADDGGILGSDDWVKVE